MNGKAQQEAKSAVWLLSDEASWPLKLAELMSDPAK